MNEAVAMATEKQAVSKGYKQTEVGVIPEDWKLEKLDKLTDLIIDGTHHTPNYTEFGVPFLRVTDIQGDIDEASLKYVSQAEHDVLIKRAKPEFGDLLLSKNGTIGIPRVVDWHWDFSIFVSLALIKPKKKLLNSFYLEQFFKSNFLKKQLSQKAKQGTVTNLHLEEIRELLIPLPFKLEEQTAIANALSDMDALLTELEQLIAKKQAIKTATMQQLLTGKTRLPQFAIHTDGEHQGQLKGMKPSELGEIPEDWEVVDFGTIATPSSSRINPQIKGGGELCIELEHINSRKGTINAYTTTSDSSSIKSVFSKHDVLFGKLRSYLRKFWLSDMDGVCSTEIWVLKANNELVIPVFLYQIVQMDSFISCTSEAYGTHMPRADWSVVKSYQISLPSIEEQTFIANILSDMDAEIQVLEQRLAKTRQIKQGMMQELLTGKTRLPVEVDD